MTPQAARASYRRQLRQHGETLVARRYEDDGSETNANALGRVVGFTPEEIASGVGQGQRKVLILAEDLEENGFPLPLEEGQDALIVRGAKMTIDVVDDSTARIGDVVIAYWLRVSGA